MAIKEQIEPGKRYGFMTYVCDAESVNGYRYVKMQCDCGRHKVMSYQYLSIPFALSCNSVICKNKVISNFDKMLTQKIKRIKNLDAIIIKKEVESKIDFEGVKSLKTLTEYWREIESTGNVHNISHGMLMTRQFLVN